MTENETAAVIVDSALKIHKTLIKDGIQRVVNRLVE